MGYGKARNLVWFSFLAVFALGGLIVFFSFAWVPVYQAHTVDAILTPDEVRDPKLIEVVNRTQRYNTPRLGNLVGPYRALGVLTLVAATVGLIALRDVPRPLVPGVIGMRFR